MPPGHVKQVSLLPGNNWGSSSKSTYFSAWVEEGDEAISRDIFCVTFSQCSVNWSLGLLLNFVQCTEQLSATKNYLDPYTNGAKVEKL